MRTWPILLALLLAAVCAASPPTYSEAVRLSESTAQNAQTKEWVENVLTPFSNQHMEPVLRSCIEMLSEGSTAARFVVDVQTAPSSVVVIDDASTPFSDCLRDKLQALEWPKPPKDIRYLPIVINAHWPKDEAQHADDVIMSVTPANISLERARER